MSIDLPIYQFSYNPGFGKNGSPKSLFNTRSYGKTTQSKCRAGQVSFSKRESKTAHTDGHPDYWSACYLKCGEQRLRQISQ